MIRRLVSLFALFSMAFVAAPAWADEYQDTINVFKKANESTAFFKTAYGYAVFPTIGKGGVGVGGAYGKGRVYEKGKYIGDTSMSQVTVGLPARRPGVQPDRLLPGRALAEGIHQRQLRVRRRSVGGRDYRGRQCESEHVGLLSRRERHEERGQERGCLQQRHGDVHRRERRADVRGEHRRPEIQLQGALIARFGRRGGRCNARLLPAQAGRVP